MAKKIIQKANDFELMAEFLGYHKSYYDHGRNGKSIIYLSSSKQGSYLSLNELRSFKEDMNILMSIVSHIVEMKFQFQIVSFCHCKLFNENIVFESKYNHDNIKDCIWDTCIQFVNYYNKNR